MKKIFLVLAVIALSGCSYLNMGKKGGKAKQPPAQTMQTPQNQAVQTKSLDQPSMEASVAAPVAPAATTAQNNTETRSMQPIYQHPGQEYNSKQKRGYSVPSFSKK